jgi:hypothetical protein
MDNLDFLKNSPALQLLKQLNAPLAIAQKTAAFCDSLSHSSSLMAAISECQVDRVGSIASMASALSTNQAAWVSQITATERAIEAMNRDWAREESLIAAAGKMAQASCVPQLSVTEKVIEVMEQDWAPLSATMKLAQEKWALEAKGFGAVVESWRLDLAKECAFLGTAWMTAQAAWRLDAAHIASVLQPLKAQTLPMPPAWVASISLEKIAPPRAVLYSTPQIQLPTNRLLRRPFSNYRMAESYDLLSDFERDLRIFIHQRMSDAFGSDWEKSRVPPEMHKRWQEKQEKANLAGEPQGLLIDYADFADYVTLITQRNNWADIFQVYFRRAEFVRESLYRLHPIRVCTMHSRVLSRKMLLILQTETTLLSERMWN